MSYLFSDTTEAGQELHKGPRRKFGAFHYFRALSDIHEKGRTGRARISALLDIGEGSVRTLLDDLEGAGLITRNNAGIVLTADGQKALKGFPVRLRSLHECLLFPGLFSSMAVVRGRGRKVSNGIVQRDAAIRNGGAAAITMVVDERRLSLPPDYKAVEDGSALEAAFVHLGASEGDAVIIGAARSDIASQKAAFYAATTLL